MPAKSAALILMLLTAVIAIGCGDSPSQNQSAVASQNYALQLTSQQQAFYTETGGRFLRGSPSRASQLVAEDSQILQQHNNFVVHLRGQNIVPPYRTEPAEIQAINTPQGVQVTATFRFFAMVPTPNSDRTEQLLLTPEVTFLERTPISLRW